MKLFFPVVFLLLSQALLSQDRLVEAYPEVFARAAKEHKNVFFIFSHERCGWCRVFDRYHELPEVKEILEKNYLFEVIDITDSEPETALWEHYNFIGVPAWLIYSSKKELLFEGKSEEGKPVGYPIEPEGMDVYIDAIRKSSRRINKKQLQVLREKIVYCDEHY
jgi:hypothetical protein